MTKDGWWSHCCTHESNWWLGCFRILWAGLMLHHALAPMRHNFTWVWERYYSSFQNFRFPLPGGIELPPVPETQVVQLGLVVMAICALAILLGTYYHEAMAVYVGCDMYLFLSAPDWYSDGAWFFLLTTMMMALLPAHESLGTKTHPTHRTIPRWMRHALTTQILLVHAFSALNHLDADWLRAEPMRTWVNGRAGWFAPYLLSYGVLAYQGATPFLMVGAEWGHQKLWATLNVWFSVLVQGARMAWGADWIWPLTTLILTTLPSLVRLGSAPPQIIGSQKRAFRYRRWLILALLVLQVALPLSPHVWQWSNKTGPVNWGDEGRHFSWQGDAQRFAVGQLYVVEDGEGGEEETAAWSYDPTKRNMADGSSQPIRHLTLAKWFRAMNHPDMLMQTALTTAHLHYLMTGNTSRVYGNFLLSVNGRPWAPWVRPRTCLSCPDTSSWPSEWLDPPPTFPGPLRFQYPWWWWEGEKDNPCFPWNFQPLGKWSVPEGTTNLNTTLHDPRPCDTWWAREGPEWLARTQHSWWVRVPEAILGVWDDRDKK